MTRTPHTARARLAALIGILLTLSSCSIPATSPGPLVVSSGSAVGSGFDQAFYGALKVEDGSELRPPSTIKEAARASAMVVAGRVRDVQLWRTQGEADSPDSVVFAGVTLSDVTVLSGALRTPAESVVVEFLIPDGDKNKISWMRDHLPRGEGVWFLRWNGEVSTMAKAGAPPPTGKLLLSYSLISTQGLFVEQSGKVRSAVASADDTTTDTMKADGERRASLADLKRAVQA